MLNTPRTASVISCVLACVTAACHTSPPSRFYTLSAAAVPTATSSKIAVAVGPVSMPAVVDRPEFVVRTGDNEVRLDEFNRWASPLADNLTLVVAENLVQMLGSPHVMLFPQTLAADADFRVAIEVQRFESTPGKSATIDAIWTVTRTADGKTQTGRGTEHEPVQDGSYDALAAAHSRALARISQAIAATVHALSGP